MHIISLDVPYPPDYGGAMDIFCRIVCLYKLGFKLTIHIFEYGRGKQNELEKFGRVFYYKRNFSSRLHLSKKPFIVSSRKSQELLENLSNDLDPILFEGIHTTYFLGHPKLRNRQKFVRAHNIEHEYYYQLAIHSNSGLKKLFFLLESRKLRAFEQNLIYANGILAIKKQDVEHFEKINSNVKLLPASIPKELAHFHETKKFALFHGNLSVIENENAVFKIHHMIKSELNEDFKLVVAGKKPSQKLERFSAEQGIILIQNPSIEEMNKLIYDARIHVFQTECESGVKLKLLKSINSCGHILTTQKLIFDSDISELCHIAYNENEFKSKFKLLKNNSLYSSEFDKRMKFLRKLFMQEEQILLNLLEN